MADLLTHVLTAYVLAMLLSFRDDRITPAMVTAAMVGGLVPDLNRIGLVVPASTVELILGVPFGWDALLTVGGVSVVLGLGTLLVPPRFRRRTAAMLGLGAAAHFLRLSPPVPLGVYAPVPLAGDRRRTAGPRPVPEFGSLACRRRRHSRHHRSSCRVSVPDG